MPPKCNPLPSDDVLKDLYINQRQSIAKIAEKYSVDRKKISNKLKELKVNVSKARILDIKGLRSGKLVAIKYLYSKKDSDNSSNAIWECKCDCGNRKEVIASRIKRKNIKSCGKCLSGPELGTWKGYKNLSGSMWSRLKNRAKIRGLDLTVTKEELVKKFESQNAKCALSGLNITLTAANDEKDTASIDRIDSNKGYHSDNIQWVHKDVNTLKLFLQEEELFSLCKTVYNYNNLGGCNE
jgi:hypothetical protein